ncbi:MAG TPA: DUF1080 domain-containing protein [Bryobacteraceae bacterium]|nr:DUF1080 domain-containing protein [Bryobacteraceae bacterium]
MRNVVFSFLAATALAVAQQTAGDDKTGYTDTPIIPGQKWRVHGAERPRPVKVRAKVGEVPSDAIVLFDGKDLSKWVTVKQGNKEVAPEWKVQDGVLEIVPLTGRLRTKEKFGDIQLHVEWQIPKGSQDAGQGRGNSGIEIMGRYEIQVLESHDNLTYADGQAASIYGQYPPLVNASSPEGEWNVYDIFFEAPKFDGEKLVKPAHVTVVHNGVLVHHRQEILGPAIHRRNTMYRAHEPEEPLSLQDHKRTVRYRNIWVRRLKPYDAQ